MNGRRSWSTLGEATTDIVLITGGLGPTKDDITKHTLCEFFGTTLDTTSGDRGEDH